MTTKKKTRPCLLLDKHRGIYMAHDVTEVRETSAGVAVMAVGIRHIFSFSVAEQGARGVWGLAVTGPGSRSKVGPSVNGTVYDIVKILECTDQAMEALKVASW